MNFKVVTTEYFEKQVKHLRKKYPHIIDDIFPVVTQLESGHIVGDSIPGLHNKAYKVRIKSTDQRKGKSGGYRVVYYFKTTANLIYLLTVYVKAERENLTTAEVKYLIANYIDQVK